MSYKLRAYRAAGGATCPEATIFYLLLYALLYILKHETWDGRVAANELHEVSRTTKMKEASLSFLFKLSMPSLHLLMPPRAADTLYEAGIPQRGSCPLHLTLALANRSRYLFCCHDWIRLDCIENGSLSVTDNAFAPTTLPTPLPTLPTSFPTFVPLAGQLTWSLGLFPWPLLGGSMLSRTKTMYKSIHHVIAALGVAPEDPRLEVVVEDNLRTRPLRQEIELLWGAWCLLPCRTTKSRNFVGSMALIAISRAGRQISLRHKKSPTHRAFPGVDRSLPPLLRLFYNVGQAVRPATIRYLQTARRQGSVGVAM